MMTLQLSPINQRRLTSFRRNKRALWSLRIFIVVFLLSLVAELIANDKPLLVHYDGKFYLPIFSAYPETTFGGDFETEADYQDEFTVELIEEKGWIVWPLVPYSYDTHIDDLETPAPSPPSLKNWLGTDDQARDVVARVVYGFRISILFALSLTLASCAIGIFVGAVQGYFGGKTDLIGQRILEVWGGLPVLFLLIIMAAIVKPSFWTLLGIMVLFSWTALVDVVRAEFLKGRNLEYVRAAKAMGVSDFTIMTRHVLPNALVATMTMVPFIITGSITTLTSLDFLGFGMPPGSPSLGELVAQGKGNLQAPWLALTAFTVLSLMLTLLVFIGEGVRDAFDPRHIHRHGESS